MAIRDFLIRKLGGVPIPQQPVPGARAHVLQAGRGGVGFGSGRRREVAPGVRVGSWVRWEGRTGIVTGQSDDGLLAVDIVNDAGETVIGTHQPWSAMRKATMSEIPERRRPSPEVARRFGYAED